MRPRRSATDFKHFSNKNGRFSVKTYHFCVIARRAQFFAPDAAIFNGTKRHPGTKFGETARSGMRPTCTPSPCTSCLVFPYKTAGRSKQIRLLLPFLPPDGVSAQPPCSAAFQRSCVLHRAFSYDPSACSADRIPARTKKIPIPDAQREGCGSQGSQQNPSQGDRRLRFRSFYSVPDGSYCKRGKNVL